MQHRIINERYIIDLYLLLVLVKLGGGGLCSLSRFVSHYVLHTGACFCNKCSFYSIIVTPGVELQNSHYTQRSARCAAGIGLN